MLIYVWAKYTYNRINIESFPHTQKKRKHKRRKENVEKLPQKAYIFKTPKMGRVT